MKRTILTTMLALSLSVGVNSVYAQQGVKWSNTASKPQFASCSSCSHWGGGSDSAIATWRKVMFLLLMVYIP